MSNTGTTLGRKFYLLAWKNFQTLCNHRFQLLISVLAPSVFATILVYIRFATEVIQAEFLKNEHIRPEVKWMSTIQQLAENHKSVAKNGFEMYNCFLPKLIVAYAPNSTMYSELMNLAASEYLNNIELQGFNTIKELRSTMIKEHFFAGVGFNDVPNTNFNEEINAETVDKSLSLDFSLVFPSELRFFNETFIGESWKTHHTHNHNFYIEGERRCFDAYVREGFISLQHGVSMAFIKSVVVDKNLPTVVISRFPRKIQKFDPMIDKFKNNLSIVILVGYLYPCMVVTMSMLREKEQNLKSLLEILGIGEIINFVSWYLRGFIILISGSLLLLILLKVKWTDGFGIFTFSSWFTLYYFLFCYNIASISFCFLISSTVDSTDTGVVLITFFWFFTYLPYPASRNLVKASIITKIFSVIFSNTAMGIAFREIAILEELQEGLQWNNLFKSAHKKSYWSVGTLSSILILLSIVYIILAINMSRLSTMVDFLKEKFLALICPSRNTKVIRGSLRSLISYRKSKVFAIESEDKKVIIEIKNLTKVYNGRHAVHDVSLNIYDGEITVIMGHNGAGKSTLLSIVAGLVRPTSGSTFFRGANMRKSSYYGLNIGFCFQHIIFPELTVASNIIFYSRLKGLKNADVQDEVTKYLDAMNLNNISHVLACNLTNGLKQTLSICCALCGNSKYVILDEPSADMDAVARKKLWQLLISEKNNRTIIIATNSTEEAEVLGDRLAIMSGGLLMCFGSPYFLKAIYGRGYRLICLKNPHCDSELVTAFLRTQIPNIAPESEIGIELSYRLSEGYSAIIPKLLADLEESLKVLHISSCSITEPCVEDIFLRMGAEDPGEDNRFRQNEIMNGLTIYSEEYSKLSQINRYESYKGLKLLLTQLCAMLWKRIAYGKSKKSSFFQYLMPATVATLTFIISGTRVERTPLEPIKFSITEFPETLTAVAGLTGEASAIENQRCNYFKHYYETLPYLSVVHKVYIIENRTFTDYTRDKTRERSDIDRKHIVGASYDVKNGSTYYIISWFNNYFRHSAPLSLNLAHNGLLASREHNGRITVTIDPLPFTSKFDPVHIHVNSYAGNYLPINLTFIILIVYTSILLFLINERTTGFKLLQYIYGMRNLTFWLGSTLSDCLRITIISFTVFLVIIIYEHESEDDLHCAVGHFCMLVFFGICMAPFYYLVSLFFYDNSLGFILITSLNIYGVVGFCGVRETLKRQNLNLLDLPLGYKLIRYFVPYYSLTTALMKLFCIEQLDDVCRIDDIKNVSIMVDNCLTAPNCCIENEIFSWEYLGLLPELTYLLCFGLIFSLLLVVHGYLTALKKFFGFTRTTDNLELAFKDYKLKHDEDTTFQDQLIYEALRVENLTRGQYRTKPLVLTNVSKIYGRKNRQKVAVDRVTLLLERCECFGMLGINGSGKSLFIKMLVGDEEMTCGRVYVNGISLTDDSYRMYQLIGYSPYSQSAFINMTCRGLLTFFCRLRGMKKHRFKEITDCLVKVLGITKYYDEDLQFVSAGVKRRLGIAIAFIGNPSIVYLDGYSVNVDPAGRRQICNIICRMCALGKTVMLTAHSALDCERFCTRFGVINNGKIICLDSVYNMQNKYIHGYILQVKVKTPFKRKRSKLSTRPGSSRVSQANPYLKVMAYVENEFPNSSVRDHHGVMVSFLIPPEEMSLSIIYRKVQRNAFLLNIENFSITRETISLLFADLVETAPISLVTESMATLSVTSGHYFTNR